MKHKLLHLCLQELQKQAILLLLTKAGEVNYLYLPENKIIVPKITNE